MTTADIRHLRTFLAVAHALSFSRAARTLGVTQPALSQQIALLERQVGAPLFRRRPRVALTDAGRVLADEADRILARFARGMSLVAEVARGERGQLTIGYAASAVLGGLPAVIREFRAAHPDVVLRLRELAAAEELEAVATGAVNVAFVRETTVTHDLSLLPVLQEGFAVLLPRRHRLAAAARVRAADLADEPWVHFPRDVAPSLHDQIGIVTARAGFVPRVVQEAREWLTHIMLVQAGLGIAVVPESFRQLRLGHLVLRPIRGTAGMARIAMAMPSEAASTAARRFAALATARVSDLNGVTVEAPPRRSGR
jgi:DNA-binding transcriptional LysR family regulator